MVADPKYSFQAQTTSRWSAHWRFAFKPAPAGRGVLGLAPVRVTRSCSPPKRGPVSLNRRCRQANTCKQVEVGNKWVQARWCGDKRAGQGGEAGAE